MEEDMENHLWLQNFNSAAESFQKGHVQEALEKYSSLFITEAETPEHMIWNEKVIDSAWLFVEIRLRIAFCFIELNEFIEARIELERPQLLELLAQGQPAQLHSYYFSYANVLSKLGHFESAELCYQKAFEVGAVILKDAAAAERTLRFRLQNAQRFGKWDKLLEIARQAAHFAQQKQLDSLLQASREAACLSYRGLLRFADARKGAELILQQLHRAHAPQSQKNKWVEFINNLNRQPEL